MDSKEAYCREGTALDLFQNRCYAKSWKARYYRQILSLPYSFVPISSPEGVLCSCLLTWAKKL